MNTSEFWQWVCKRKAYDNPRGDLIRDTRDLVDAGINPETRRHRLRSNPEGEREYQKLLKDYQKEKRVEEAAADLDAIGLTGDSS